MNLDVKKTILNQRGHINSYYDLKLENVEEMQKMSHGDTLEFISNSFVFGYAQGIKAYKAEMKRNRVRK